MRLPRQLPACAVNLLARPEWFSDPGMVARAVFEPANAVARLLSSPRFSGTDFIWAITLGKTIHVRMLDQYNPHTATGLALIAHELKHVEQYEQEGWLGFFAKYLQSYAAQGGYGKAVRFEDAAYAFQQSVEHHLKGEFNTNLGINCCLEMQDPHTPNFAFFKSVPPVFRFDP